MENIILEILNSRRLLSDHIEILEQVLYDLHQNIEQQTNYYIWQFIPILATSITSSLLLRQRYSNFKYFAPIIFSGYAVFCVSRFVRNFKQKQRKQPISLLIRRISDFDICIRRNLAYFKESIIFKQHLTQALNESSNESKLIQKTTGNLMEIIKLLSEHIKHLESLELPSKYSTVYERLENLDDWELFQKSTNEIGSENLKDVYNFFLYIQSQFLTRLGLALIYNKNDCETFLNVKIGIICKKINELIQNDNSLHAIITNNLAIESKIKIFRSQIGVSEPLAMLRGYSLSLTSRMLAAADGCRKIDSTIQDIAANSHNDYQSRNKSILENLMPALKTLENAISMCEDDYKRLQLTTCKYLNIQDDEMIDESFDEEKKDESKQKIVNLNTDSEVDETDREFFARIDMSKIADAENEQNKSGNYSIDDELQNINSKFARKQFKPVLKQLKTKISPIKQSMKTREQNYLKAHGLQIHEEGNLEEDESESSESNDDGDNSGQATAKKKIQNDQKYDEMRKFLEQKSQQVDLAQIKSFLPMLPKPNFDEDILE